VPLLQPKSRVHVRMPNRKDVSLACYRKVSSVSVASDDGRLFHSVGVQAAKLHGPKLDV